MKIISLMHSEDVEVLKQERANKPIAVEDHLGELLRQINLQVVLQVDEKVVTLQYCLANFR